jgi:hypothetical protein
MEEQNATGLQEDVETTTILDDLVVTFNFDLIRNSGSLSFICSCSVQFVPDISLPNRLIDNVIILFCRERILGITLYYMCEIQTLEELRVPRTK